MSEALVTQMQDLAGKIRAVQSTDGHEHLMAQMGTIALANLDRIAAAFDSAAMPAELTQAVSITQTQKLITDTYAATLLQIRRVTTEEVIRALVRRAFDSVAGMSTPIADSNQRGAA